MTEIPVRRDASRFNSSAASLQAGLPPSPLPPLTGTTAISEPKANISWVNSPLGNRLISITGRLRSDSIPVGARTTIFSSRTSFTLPFSMFITVSRTCEISPNSTLPTRRWMASSALFACVTPSSPTPARRTSPNISKSLARRTSSKITKSGRTRNITSAVFSRLPSRGAYCVTL